jgi:biotin carboxyl carrier protein
MKRDLTVTRIADGAFRVESDGRATIVYVGGHSGARTAWWDGRLFEERAEDARSRRGTRRAASGALSAPMPATVISVLVKPGDRIGKGQTAVLLEAMKMEWPLKADADAVVAKVNCREGDLVQPDVPLVEFDGPA